MKVLYGVYDLEDHERLVMVGNNREVAKLLNKTEGTIRSSVTRKTSVNGRYLIERVEEKDGQEEEKL